MFVQPNVAFYWALFFPVLELLPLPRAEAEHILRQRTDMLGEGELTLQIESSPMTKERLRPAAAHH